MSLRVNRIHFPVTVLGPGHRVGIWLQGCQIRCPGCLSRDTWDASAGQLLETETLVDSCRRLSAGMLDGITISGGEPLDQMDGLLEFLERLHVWRDGLDVPFDILCYTGRSLQWVKRRCPALLDHLDAIIPDPYVIGRPRSHPWYGSDNQSLTILSDLGRERFQLDPTETLPGKPTVQLAVDAQHIWLIGLPRPGDLDALAKTLSSHGIRLAELSWRT